MADAPLAYNYLMSKKTSKIKPEPSTRTETTPSGVGKRYISLVSHLFAAIILVYLLFLSFKPLADPDLWIHLKTGQWIVESGALPGSDDPFSYTTPTPLSTQQVQGVRSQWFGQTVLYLVQQAGGIKGLSIFRSLLIILPFAFIYFKFRKSAEPYLLIPAVALPPFLVSLSLGNTYERPQAFSFVISLPVFLILERLRKPETSNKARKLFSALLVIIMLLWSNIHGGYIVGVAMIFIYVGGLLLNSLLAKTGICAEGLAPRVKRTFFAVSASAVLATMINPAGPSILIGWLRAMPYYLFHSASAGSGVASAQAGFVLNEVLEYKSLWYFYTEFGLEWPLYIGLFLFASAVSLLMRHVSERRVDFAELGVAVFMIFFGFYYARWISFALIFSSYFLARSIASMKDRYFRAVPSFISFAILVSLCVFVYRTTPWEFEPSAPSDFIEPALYLDGAIKFLDDHKVRGPMFNDMRWGGYLIWRAYPGRKVFYDGRVLSDAVGAKYMDVINATPRWKAILDSYGVNFLLLPVMSKENGTIAPVVMRILEEGPVQWRLVYLWDNVVVFVRNSPVNKEPIDCCAMPFSELYREIRDLSDLSMTTLPDSQYLLLSKAFALVGLGEYREAEAILNSLPQTPMSKSLLMKIGKR